MDNDSGDELVTVEEFLDKEAAEEESADLVLGGDDGRECTYNSGYVPRQAIFSCLTCVPAGNAGICTACSLSCHDGHEIVELWTKRRFRCDCGNSKFGGQECKLCKVKEPENEKNAYNQNFRGLYCTCHRPYPNPEDEELGEMLQCCICEDWFHEAHLGLPASEKVPRDEEGDPNFDELICPTCVTTWSSVLSAYWVEHQQRDKAEKQNETSENHGKLDEVAGTSEPSASDKPSCSQKPEESTVCKLPTSQSRELPAKAVFLDRSWRTALCKCDDCCRRYESNGLSFLLDSLDSMQNYEAMAKQKRLKKLEVAEGAGLKFLQNMNHVAKIEFLHGLNDMTSELNTFFESFRESGKTVTSADIYEFFEQLKRKRRRTAV